MSTSLECHPLQLKKPIFNFSPCMLSCPPTSQSLSTLSLPTPLYVTYKTGLRWAAVAPWAMIFLSPVMASWSLFNLSSLRLTTSSHFLWILFIFVLSVWNVYSLQCCSIWMQFVCCPGPLALIVFFCFFFNWLVCLLPFYCQFKTIFTLITRAILPCTLL